MPRKWIKLVQNGQKAKQNEGQSRRSITCGRWVDFVSPCFITHNWPQSGWITGGKFSINKFPFLKLKRNTVWRSEGWCLLLLGGLLLRGKYVKCEIRFKGLSWSTNKHYHIHQLWNKYGAQQHETYRLFLAITTTQALLSRHFHDSLQQHST